MDGTLHYLYSYYKLLSEFCRTYFQCKAISAVALNNPEGFVLVNITTDNRYKMLRDRQVDVLVGGETHTIEREVMEVRSYISFVSISSSVTVLNDLP
jgi:hypothetical protein